jgi:Protein of unknown function DUF262
VTSLQLDRLGSASFSIPDLVTLAAEGAIRVPTFQRQFVWTAKDVRDLFDSLYRGFPVGTLLLWRHRAPAGRIQLGSVALDVAEDPNALWVVDGQQRMTSLFASLWQGHDGTDGRFQVYFDLGRKKFINPRSGAVPPRAIPVKEALETRSLLNWLRQHSADLESDDFDLADSLGGALRDYRIPAYVVSGEDQTLLREVFDRVNSAGKPISRAQVFHALFARDGQPGSPASVVAELRSLGFGDLDESRIVQSVLAIRGGDVQRDVRAEFDENEDPADWYDRAEQALVRSIGFLRSEGVEHQLLMPNALPIPVLAAFFHVYPDPEPWTLRLLSRWLWRGWVHGFGEESGQTPILRRAVRSVNPEHRNLGSAPAEFDAVKALLDHTPDREAPRLDLLDFRTNSAKSRLILLAMAAQLPRRADGTAIDLAAAFQADGVGAVTEFVRGHRTNAAARGFWPAGAEFATSVLADEELMRSHVLDATAVRYLLRGDVEDFLQRRGAQLAELTFAFLDSHLERGALVRRSLRELALTGAAEGDP